MASWIIHLRIADRLLEQLDVDAENFIAGNIAPDCGKKLPDGGFFPDAHVTHFTASGKGSCDYNGFYEKYVRPEKVPARQAFYLGYYVHLFTDVLWVRNINEPCKKKFNALYTSDRDEYYRRVKANWYGLDHLWLRNNPCFRSWNIFKTLTSFRNDFLSFYDEDNLSVQFAGIVRFYTSAPPVADRDFPYLSPFQAEEFVRCASQEILNDIKGKEYTYNEQKGNC